GVRVPPSAPKKLSRKKNAEATPHLVRAFALSRVAAGVGNPSEKDEATRTVPPVYSSSMKEALIADEVRLPIDCETDIVAARRNGQELAGYCGFPFIDLVGVSTAISELARHIVGYAARRENSFR